MLYLPSKISRMKYASLVSGVSTGQRSRRFENASSETTASACPFNLQCVDKKSVGEEWRKGVLLPVNPRVSDTVGELFFLPPENGVRKVRL